MGPPCAENCNFKFQTRIDDRQQLFESYWKLGNLDKQRHFLLKCMEKLPPRFDSQTKESQDYSTTPFIFISRIRKKVYANAFSWTLGISDRPIRTVLKKTNEMGFLEPEKKGKHDNHYQVDGRIKQSVRDFINAIPHMESHYLRAQTYNTLKVAGASLNFIDTIKNSKIKKGSHLQSCNVLKNFQWRIQHFIFLSQKGLVPVFQKLTRWSYNGRKVWRSPIWESSKQDEKRLGQRLCPWKHVIIHCLLFPFTSCNAISRGNTSLFYYKSKVNCYNFTITNILNGETKCYFWYQEKRNIRANEIASCIFKYLEEITGKISDDNLEVVFYT